MTSDIKTISVIICDDIRREPSGKDILIGVYAGVILVPSLPAVMSSFSMRIEFTTALKHADDMTIEMRDPDDKPLFSVTGAMEMIGKDGMQVLSLVCNNVEFKELGTYTLYFGHKDSLAAVYSIPVRLELA